MKANNSSLLWSANCKTLLLLVVFALEVSTVKAGNEHVFTDTIPIVEHEGHILMPVTINHKLKHLVFDTGSMYLSLWSKDITSKMKSIRNSSDSVKKVTNTDLEVGRELVSFGTQCDSLIACYLIFPDKMNDKWGRIGDGTMGFCPLIKRGLGYFVKVDLRKGIMIVSNDHRWVKQTKGIKVSYMKCNALPTFNVTIGKKHKMRIALDSGAAHFCTVSSSILNKWENTDKDFKNCKSFEKMVSESYICDTTLVKRKARGYKCDFAIKSFIIKDAVVIENRPDHIDSIGEEIFHKAVISFDPWHRKIIFQPYYK